MAKVDPKKVQALIERRTQLHELLSANELTQKEIDEQMKWEDKKEKAKVYKALRENGYIPVDKNGKPWACPIEDYADFMEEQKDVAVDKTEEPKKPKIKDPQGKRFKAEQAYIKALNNANTANQELIDNPGEETTLKFIIADAKAKLARLKLDQAKTAIALAFGIPLDEVNRIKNLNDLLEEN